MAAIPSLHLPRPAATRKPVRSTTWLALTCLCAVATGFAVAQMAPSREIDADLVVLLRAMAAIKALLVVAAFGVVAWRFTLPTSPRIALAYAASIAAMSFATALIWMSAFIGLAALSFHVGLFGALYAAWRDDRVPSFRANR